jgi:hypothetical protein
MCCDSVSELWKEEATAYSIVRYIFPVTQCANAPIHPMVLLIHPIVLSMASLYVFLPVCMVEGTMTLIRRAGYLRPFSRTYRLYKYERLRTTRFFCENIFICFDFLVVVKPALFH